MAIKTISKKRKIKRNEPIFVYAYDPILDRRVVHVIENGYAISLLTGRKFKIKTKLYQ